MLINILIGLDVYIVLTAFNLASIKYWTNRPLDNVDILLGVIPVLSTVLIITVWIAGFFMVVLKND